MQECWNCRAALIWGGDHDDEDIDGNEYIVSNLSCPNCDTFYIVGVPLEPDDD